MLDEFYSKKLLAEIPGIVERAMMLSPLESQMNIPRQVNVYLEQATRAFVAGLWDGAVALARACLEAAFEDRIGYFIGRQARELKVWIGEAEQKRLMSNEQLKNARINISGIGCFTRTAQNKPTRIDQLAQLARSVAS
jgi:hypothetical protein